MNGDKKSFLAQLKERWTKHRTSDYQVFLFFFLVSAAFWVLQNLNEDYELAVQAPLVLTGVPEDVIITSELPPSVLVTITDHGTSLVRFYNRKMSPVLLDFKTYDKGVECGRAQVPLGDVRLAIEMQLSSTTRIVSVESDTLDFYYNRGVCRRLPVQLMGRIATKSQNYLRSVSVKPDSVMVYAPQAMLDTMRLAYTQSVNLTDLAESTILQVPFTQAKGVKCIPQEVELHADVDYYTEKSVEIPIIGLNFPADKSLRTFPGKATVTFRIGASEYNRVTADDFVLLITYEELMSNELPKYQLHLKSYPECISNVRIQPSEVDYLIEQSAEEGGDE